MKHVLLLVGYFSSFTAGIFATSQSQLISLSIKNHTSDRIVAVLALKAGMNRIKCAPQPQHFYTGDLRLNFQHILPSILTKNARLSFAALVAPHNKSHNVMINNCFDKNSRTLIFPDKHYGEVAFGDPDKLRYFSLFIGVSNVPFAIKQRREQGQRIEQPKRPDQLIWYERKLKLEDSGTIINFYHPKKQKAQFDRQGQFKPVGIK